MAVINGGGIRSSIDETNNNGHYIFCLLLYTFYYPFFLVHLVLCCDLTQKNFILKTIGDVTIEDVLTALPFQNTIDLVELKGKDIVAMFEHSVTNFDPKGHHLAGKFLQVSGKLCLI